MKSNIGISFRGGAAKGLGSIGLIRYFQEQKIVPHALGGSSIGAIIAVLYSLNFDWQRIFDLLTHIHIREFLSLGSVFKKGIFISKDKFRAKILEYTGDTKVEDLPIPTIIFATDPKIGKRVDLVKGSVVDALMASCAYPILMNPVIIDGVPLVDGDFFPSYSTDILRSLGADTIIGVGGNYTAHVDDVDKNVLEQIQNTYNTLMSNYEQNIAEKDVVDIMIAYNSDDIPRFNFEVGGKLVDRVYDLVRINPEIKKLIHS